MVDKRSQASDAVNRFLAEHRELSTLVRDAQKFSLQLPLIGKVGVPRPRELAAYGILGGLAVGGIIEWPAAIGLAIGLTLADRSMSTIRERERTQAVAAAEPTIVDGVVVPKNTTAKLAARTPTNRAERPNRKN